MRFIAHRGNVKGSDPKRENRRSFIQEALNLGFDVEIDALTFDINMIDGSIGIVLGHDEEVSRLSESFLTQYHDRLWIHCKNRSVFNFLSKLKYGLNLFMHEEEPFVFTTQGLRVNHVYNSYPAIGSNSILLDFDPRMRPDLVDFGGICTDYPLWYRNYHNKLIEIKND